MSEQIKQTEVLAAPAFTLEEAIAKIAPESIFLVVEVEGEQTDDELIVLSSPVLDRITGTASKVSSGQALLVDGKLALINPKQTKVMLSAELVLNLNEDGITVVCMAEEHDEIKVGYILG